MKKIIFLLLLTTYLTSAYSQNVDDEDNEKTITLNNYNTLGYLNRVRLDSLPASYATIEIVHLPGHYYKFTAHFNIGQEKNEGRRDQYYLIYDKESHILIYNSKAALINFLDFNGWEFKNLLPNGTTNLEVVYLFKKKSG